METHPSGWLKLTSATGRQSSYSLSDGQEMVIGRSPDCHILLDSTVHGGVSRRHAAVKASGTKTAQGLVIWQICDLGSANGTFVNGQLCQGWQTLTMGDRISLGQDGPQFIFEQQSPIPVPPPRPPQVSNDLSVSQLLPVVSAPRDLLKKGYLLPGIFTVAIVVSLFATIGNLNAFNYLLALYIGCGAFFFIYRLCGQRKSWLAIFFAAAFTMIALVDLPSPPFPDNTPGLILLIFVLLYRYGFLGLLLIPLGLGLLVVALVKVTKGLAKHAAGWAGTGLSCMIVGIWILASGDFVAKNLENAEADFITTFISHLWGAGLMEEMLKALPIFALFAFGNLLAPPNRQRFGVWEPLDGIIFGAASALGFTLVETVGQYVPNIMAQVAQRYGEGAGSLAAIQLLIPRVLGSIAGHMAYSGYFGYFIGLSILKPKQRFQILAIGYITSSLLHAFWNATPSLASSLGGVGVNIVQMVIGIASYAFLTAAIIKARQLSPNRSKNFATQIAPPY
jgi:RsiW-degrading membrane proteinase PrsW (M82 family)